MAWGQETSEAQSQDSKWKFVIGAGYIFAPSIVEFNDLKYSDSNHNHGSGTASLQYGTTYSISLEVKKLPQHSWGVFGGLNYQGEREFEKGYIIVGGDYLDIAGGSGASRVQFSTIYGNVAYRGESFYIPFGLNFSTVRFKPASGFEGSISVKGGPGAQFGVGWAFNDRIFVELYSWVTTMRLKASSTTAITDYGDTYFRSALLLGKCVF